jgi:hypothetical protein
LFIWLCDECRARAGDEKDDIDDERTWLGKTPVLGLVEEVAKPFEGNAMVVNYWMEELVLVDNIESAFYRV